MGAFENVYNSVFMLLTEKIVIKWDLSITKDHMACTDRSNDGT